MIAESYVSFETAKMLKEAGFDVPCDKWYGEEGFFMSGNYKSCKCPTQQLAARWFREVHGLHIFTKRAYDYTLDKYTWGFWIQRAEYDTLIDMEAGFDTYESALEAGLQEALQLIIKRKEQ